MNKDSIVSPRLQKAVAKLAADEYYSSQYYALTPFAADAGQRTALAELFGKFEADSRQAMFAHLAEWMLRYGVDVPASEAEMRKSATPDVVKKATSAKKGQAANSYVDKAAEIEASVMAAYKDVIESEGVAYFTDLQSLLWQNYYSHADNASRLQTARIAIDANCDLVMN